MNSRRRVNSDVIALRFLKTMHMFALPGWTIARGEGSGLGCRLKCARPRALINVAANNCAFHAGRDNKSLDASGISGLLIRKTRMPMWLTAAASTLTLDNFFNV